MNTKKKYFISYSLLLLLLIILDSISTYLVSPDFKYEINPAPKKYGLNHFTFFLYMLMRMTPNFVLFYYHSMYFSERIKYLESPKLWPKVKAYFSAYGTNSLLNKVKSFVAAILNYNGFLLIRLGIYYRALVVLGNMLSYYLVNFIINDKNKPEEFFRLNPLPQGKNEIENYIIWKESLGGEMMMDHIYGPFFYLFLLIIIISFLKKYFFYGNERGIYFKGD